MSSLLMLLVLNAVFFISFFVIHNLYLAFAFTAVSFFALLFFFRHQTIDNDYVVKLPYLDFSNKQYNSIVVCLIIFLILEKNIGFRPSLFTSFLIFLHLNKLDSRPSFLIALIFLTTTALLTAGKNRLSAESAAIMAFYFLAIGVIWLIYTHLTQVYPSINSGSRVKSRDSP